MPNEPFDVATIDAGMQAFLGKICLQRQDALEFLCRWMQYCHAVDDVIDEGQWGPERILELLVMASEVYSCPFYAAHVSTLQGPALLATSTYADSVNWEKDPALWKRQWCEVLRHAGNDVILAVAMICGGYEHMRQMSAPLLATCYVYHKDKYGTPQ